MFNGSVQRILDVPPEGIHDRCPIVMVRPPAQALPAMLAPAFMLSLVYGVQPALKQSAICQSMLCLRRERFQATVSAACVFKRSSLIVSVARCAAGVQA